MFDPAKLAEDHIAPSDLVRDIPVGAFRIVPTSALLVDVDRRCWLDPDAKTIGDASWHPTAGSPEGLAIKRWDDGFEVGRQFIHSHKWRRSVLPVLLTDQFSWLRVVGVYESIKPTNPLT